MVHNMQIRIFGCQRYAQMLTEVQEGLVVHTIGHGNTIMTSLHPDVALLHREVKEFAVQCDLREGA